MPPGGGAMAVPAGNLASPGLRIVGGLIDVVILVIVNGIISAVLQKATGLAGLVNLVIDLGYFGYFLSQRGQTIGMMVFGFHVRDARTGQFPDVGRSILRGFIWNVEVGLTICIVGAIGWLWMLWDPNRQAIH
ncbi:MAG TPA: RDD family protein, partial [Candidatus Udaeobacter sp.]|nr:RDD family protein [Candidatus Udaeobacter sp.]